MEGRSIIEKMNHKVEKDLLLRKTQAFLSCRQLQTVGAISIKMDGNDEASTKSTVLANFILMMEPLIEMKIWFNISTTSSGVDTRSRRRL